MSTTIAIEEAQRQLRRILQNAPGGDSVTVVDATGTPLGLLVSLNFETQQAGMDPEEWTRQWDALTKRINATWKSDKSAVQILSETRR